MRKHGVWLLAGVFAFACDSGGGGGTGGGGGVDFGGGEITLDAGDSASSNTDGRVQDLALPPDQALPPDAAIRDAMVAVDGPGPVPDGLLADGLVPKPDGQIAPDAAAPCEEGLVQACQSDVCAGSTQTCTGGVWGDCTPPVELCDGLDNDCDSITDNGFDVGADCTVGAGACEVVGAYICAPDGLSAICGASPGIPQLESCNGLDDDCDGVVDGSPEGALTEECYSGPPETRGIGACHAGLSVCEGGAAGACAGEVLPGVEICNGIDDDCDGLVDEGADGQPLVDVCYDGLAGTEGAGLCHGGIHVCGAGGVFGPCEGEVVPANEICDQSDNDCNGAVDEVVGGCACEAGATQPCYAGPEGTAGVGICAAGVQTCVADGSGWGTCDGQTLPNVELCDGLDNDCNGAPDDAIEGAGVDCTAGIGACQATGTTVCDPAAGSVVCSAVPSVPQRETCDGLDNDCNGRVDDALGVGDVCVIGLGACQSRGVAVCGENGSIICGAPVISPSPELCDGIDNNCDGQVDNGLGLGQACTTGVGDCSAPGSKVCGAQGAVVCNGRALPPGVERCDGRDNDCDGAIDNDNPGGGLDCELPLAGNCGVGQTACVEGATACHQVVFSAPETCDGADEDCDGVVDNGPDGAPLQHVCYTGEAGTEDVGLCHGGVSTCEAAAFGGCVGEVVPTIEICDTLDNNCDGAVDNLGGEISCACQPGDRQACYSGPAGTDGVGLCHGGVQVCNADGLSFGPCEGEVLPGAEECDGLDNNCNAATDEGIPGVGLGCSAGVGACQSDGLTQCDGQTGEILCDAVAADPRPESCDGVDNNCDGQVDNGLNLGDACSVGVGVCAAGGVLACDGAGGVACTATAGQPTVEICDGVDNDCDGQIDNGLGLGTACAEGVGACRQAGVRVCGPDNAVVCGAQPLPPQAERCDGIDNNCDGQVDEGNPGAGAACNTGLQGACAAGTLNCGADGNLVCTPRNEPVVETCDGVDNDCDGLADEDAAGGPLSRACYEGPAGTEGVGVCTGGFAMCSAGAYGACVGEVLPGVEICDGADNDCNGTSDILAGGGVCACRPGAARDCYTGPAGTAGAGVCHGGRQACEPDGLAFGACVGEVRPGAELCDGADNDCNGAVDDAPGVDQPCTVGIGECAHGGLRICDPAGGSVICNATAGDPGAEICDGLDNDCDGAVDDVAGVGDRCQVGVGTCTRGGNMICDLAQAALRCDALPGEPSLELCDGQDNDCNGAVDDGNLPGVGQDCTTGIGACQNGGVTVCRGAGGVSCGASAGEPGAEVCDGVDNDCNGLVDDNVPGTGAACALGVGACTQPGVFVCQGSEFFCNAIPTAPTPELCDGIDNDCNGQIDDGRDCNVYTTCLDAYTKGARASAVYRLLPPGNLAAVDVYCDMTTDNGGWTLVGSTLQATFNDQGQTAYYPELATLAPAKGHVALWRGLRNVGDRFDIRFACRDAVRAAAAPMTVDLSFYRTGWYKEITTGTDAQSCFNETDGAGQDMAPPARRNNVNGAELPRGDQWNFGYLDICGDTGDFTVDFDDRGMGDNRSDGTDWGEDDNSRKCGRAGLATGQWFVFVRERRRVAVLGPDVVASLQTAGFPAERLDYLDPNVPGRLDARIYEALVLGRYAQDWSLMTPALAAAISQFALDGGSIVTESEGAAILTSGYGNFTYAGPNQAPPLGLFPGEIRGGTGPGANTPVTPVPPVDTLFTGIIGSLRGGAGTQDFVYESPMEGENTFLRTVATFPGDGGDLFPAGALPAVQRGRYCGGSVVMANFNYADNLASAGITQFLTNATRDALLSPFPALEDPCPLPLRPNLMVCGGSTRNVSEFLRGGTFLNVVNGCVPNDFTQALLVTRGAVAQAGMFDAATLQAYVRAGGIILTEYGSSDEVFNAVFTAAVPPGSKVGDCKNAVAPAIQLNNLDTFWDENRHSPPTNNRRGCGFDLQGYPGITQLGGPTAQAVTLAYRDLGKGRVWLVEADWSDNTVVDSTMDASRGMMHYMIEHGPNPYDLGRLVNAARGF